MHPSAEKRPADLQMVDRHDVVSSTVERIRRMADHRHIRLQVELEDKRLALNAESW